MSIYDSLAKRLGRKPTNDEVRAEVRRIIREAYEDVAQAGRLPHQRKP